VRLNVPYYWLLVMCTARNAPFVKSLNATVVQGHSVLLHCGSLRASGHVVKWIKNGVVGSLGDSPRFQVSVIRVAYYLYMDDHVILLH